MGRLFGTDGIRGLVDKELTSSLAKRVGCALSRMLKEKQGDSPRVLLGMDTRESSGRLAASLMEGIKNGGGIALNVGVCPTPTVAYLLNKKDFDAGVMISASHNPYEFNGIKIFGKGGYKLSDEMEDEIEDLILNDRITEEWAKKEYLDYVRSAFDYQLDGMKIGIDCANGSASYTAEDLFSSLGAECYMINHLPDGRNINEKCGSTHLDELKKLVLEKRLDIGIAFDGDADRCIAIDSDGIETDGDYIMALIALMLKNEGKLKCNAIVGTVMTNMGLKKFCKEQEIDFKCAAVGDRYVLEMMREGGYSLGGEQSGHIILSDYATTGDGQLTAVALLTAIKRSGKDLKELKKIMKKYPQVSTNIDADCNDKKSFTQDEAIQDIIKEAEKQLGGGGKIVARPSGTEPMIRISVEAATAEDAEMTCRLLEEKIKGRLKELKTSQR